jgi:hypothetical protein
MQVPLFLLYIFSSSLALVMQSGEGGYFGLRDGNGQDAVEDQAFDRVDVC